MRRAALNAWTYDVHVATYSRSSIAVTGRRSTDALQMRLDPSFDGEGIKNGLSVLIAISVKHRGPCVRVRVRTGCASPAGDKSLGGGAAAFPVRMIFQM